MVDSQISRYKGNMKPPAVRRLKRVISLLRTQSASSALLLSSASAKSKSADEHYPFRQSSDLRYLTGSDNHDLILVVLSESRVFDDKDKSKAKGAHVFLLAPPTDRNRVLWEGASSSPRQLASMLQAELIISKNPEADATRLLRGITRLYFQNEEGSVGLKIAERLVKMPAHLSSRLPRQFHHCHELLAPLRLVKDSEEIRKIKHAASITNSALFDTLPLLTPGLSENFIAGSIDFFFRTHDANPAFSTIVATGKNAATLHHKPSIQMVKRADLILIDCGAEQGGYCADITRVIPILGEFTPAQRLIYSGVLRAQLAAIKRVRHGALIEDIHRAAATELTETLIEAKVLKGKLSSLLARHAYRPYFPHSIGHSLGLDVHDVGDLRGNNKGVLTEGMIFTIEPGLYFSKAAGKIPPMGVRIEDDVLVTRRGCEVLTEGFPKHVKELLSLMNAR